MAIPPLGSSKRVHSSRDPQTLLTSHEYQWCEGNLTGPITTAPGAWYEHPEFRPAYAEPTGVDDVVMEAIAIVTSERSYGDHGYERKSPHLAIEVESTFGQEHM